MKSILLVLLVLLVSANTQRIFDYQRFLKTFNIQPANSFDYERFVSVFFSPENSDKKGGQASKQFNYDEFAKTFLEKNKLAGDFNYEAFAKSLLGNKVINENSPNQEQKDTQVGSNDQNSFDYKSFVQTFKIQCGQNCPTTFDYDAFAKSFNLLKDINSGKTFDYERFRQTFGINSSTAFDYEKFSAAFFNQLKNEKADSQNGGSVLIVDGPRNLNRQN